MAISCHRPVMKADCKSPGFGLESFVYRYPLLFDRHSVDEVTSERWETECSHPMVHQGKCMQCDKSMGNDYGIPIGYLQRSLRISRVQATKIRRTRTRNVVGMKKLHLVLDLDNTLLHSVKVAKLTAEQEYLKEIATPHKESMMEGEIFLDHKSITKLRPFVREFLREANTMFEMTIYTLGKRRHGRKMTRLIDPNGKYFAGRVISRYDCTQKGRKSLDVVLAAESNIVIVDDNSQVWPNHARNLISIEPYHYFSTEKKMGKEDEERALASILRRLRRIHRSYFSLQLGHGRIDDVRALLEHIRN